MIPSSFSAQKWFKSGFLLVLFFLLSTSSAFADELFLEWDPDEYEVNEEVSEGFVEEDQVGVLQQEYLEGYQYLFELNQEEMAGLEAVLLPLRQDISSLESQLQVLSLQIERVQRQRQFFAEKQQGLQELLSRLQIQEKFLLLEFRDVTQRFQQVVSMFFRIKLQYLMEDGRINVIQLFSEVGSPADLLFQEVLLQKVQHQLEGLIRDVVARQTQLQVLRHQTQRVSDQIQLYQQQLSSSTEVLQQQTEYKAFLLAEKARERDFFVRAIEEAREEREIILDRIQNIATGVTEQAYQDFPEERLQWPVVPALGISAGFMDAAYADRFGMEHFAIDIPTDQLTPIRAPLSGRVIAVHEAGKGYNYLQLAHRGGLSTVYGHVYSFQVAEGDIVQQGQVIALSGGAIGTNGAGKFTTGPHLHFEVLKNGVYVDPKDYLPELDQ